MPINQGHTVEVEHNGTRHQATYTVQHGVVTVAYGMATNAAITRVLPAIEAERLLREILQADNGRF